jgi:hypothetical protein
MIRFVNVGCRIKGTSVTWEGPTEIVRISLEPAPPFRFAGEKWMLEIRGATPYWGSFLTAEVMVLNVPVADEEPTSAPPR